MSNRVIVTGGSGFIGINLIEELLIQDYEVLNIDMYDTPKTNQKSLYKNIDINKYSELKSEFDTFLPDYVFHLAARTDLIGKSLDEYKTNTTGTENLIKIINEHKQIKKTIFFSSMLVCKSGYMPSNDVDYCPDTIYGQSKVEMEKLIKSAQINSSWTIVRPTSIWGPWFKTPYRDFFDMLLKNSFLDIGKKSCTKTYGYVKNAVYQTMKIKDANETHSKTYYLGDYEPINISEWANEIAFSIRNRSVPKLPFIVFRGAALFGDFLKLLGISFPLTSFRLKNMTQDNVIDLSPTIAVAPDLPASRSEGIKETLNWLKYH